MTVDIAPSGLELRERYGRIEYWWIASKAARRKGYEPKTVQLHYTLRTMDDVHQLVGRCADLQAEMNQWLGDPASAQAIVFDGTVAALIRCYQKDPNSPYHSLAQNTRRGYDSWCATLERAIGRKRVDAINGPDVRRYFLEIMKPAEPKKPPRVRLAKAAIRQMLPILLVYGIESRLPGCKPLLDIMDRMTLRVPREVRAAWKAARPQTQAMEYKHAEVIVTEALHRFAATGQRRWRSIALGVAAQFEFCVAQIDVIGEYQKIDRAKELPKDTIVVHGQIWRPGLRYQDFADGILDVARSKTDISAAFDVNEYPLFQTALASVPEKDRTGPVVVDNNGDPIKARYYASLYRTIADATGVPSNIWNMHARHGGLTEGYQAIVKRGGADSPALADLQFHGQHANIRTQIKHYIKPGAEPSRRVARARVADRKKKDSA